jgi:hypothetical protein
MPSSGKRCSVALERPDISEELIAYIIRMKIICEVGMLAVTSNVVPSSLILFALIMKVISSPETSVLTRATLCHIPEDGILHSHRSDNLKSYLNHIHRVRSHKAVIKPPFVFGQISTDSKRTRTPNGFHLISDWSRSNFSSPH